MITAACTGLRLWLLVLAGAASVLLAACAQSAPRPRLTIALAVFPAEAAHYRKFVHDFAASHHIQVVLVAQTYSDVLRALQAEAGAGHGQLDLVELDLSMLGEARNCVRPLDQLVGPAERTLFPSGAWQAATMEGRLYFVPHRLMWQAMIYNRQQVPHPPATWSQLLDFARRHPGKFALKAARYEGLICDAMPFVWDAGGNELDPWSPGAIAGLNFLRALSAELNPESAVYREMSILQAQARGEVWIHFNWPFAMGYLQSKGLAPEVDLSAAMPAGPHGESTPLGGGYFGIPTSAPHPELARAFLAYLLNPEVQRKLSRTMNWYGWAAPPAGSEAALLYAGFTAMRPFVRARPPVPDYIELSNHWQRAFRGVLFEHQANRKALSIVAKGLAPSPSGLARADRQRSR